MNTNLLPLAPWPQTLASLLPFLLAIVWRVFRRMHVTEREQWVIAWIIAATIALLLPFPWKRKLTEGLGVALVFVTLPAWFAVRDWVRSSGVGSRESRMTIQRLTSTLAGGALLLAACLTPLHLVATQAQWTEWPTERQWFYQPNDVFAAWDFLHAHAATSSVVTSDNAWVNLWIPAYAGRTTWVAHDHETPEYTRKLAEWKQLQHITTVAEADALLRANHVTHFMLTSSASFDQFRGLLNHSWTVVFSQGTVTILERG
jgi:hypothetical protein